METKEEVLLGVKELVEEQGLLFQKTYKISPVVARVFALLIIKGSEGLSFDKIISTIGAGKATVSGALKTLEDKKMASFYTKPGDRKRYFRPNPKHFINNLEDELEKAKNSLAMHHKINLFKVEANKILSDDDKLELPLVNPSNYTKYLTKQIETIEKFIEDLNSFWKDKF